jgi:hypothetical protein
MAGIAVVGIAFLGLGALVAAQLLLRRQPDRVPVRRGRP